MDGLFGLSLSPKKSRDDSTNAVTGSFNRQTDRALYFHSLASGHENYVPLHIINNASIWETDANAQPRAFKVLGQRGGQTAGESIKRRMQIANNKQKKSFWSRSHGQQRKFIFRDVRSDCYCLLGLISSLRRRKHESCTSEWRNTAVRQWLENR